MKRTVLIAAALAVVVCATPVWSQGRQRPGGPRGMGGGAMACPAMAVMPPQIGMIDREAEYLQLTEDQVAKLKSAANKCDEAMRVLMQKSADATKVLHDALLASEYDAQKVKGLALAAESAEAAVVSARIDEWTQIRSILTADQLKQLQEMMTMQRPGSGQRPMGPPAGAECFPPPGSDRPLPPPEQDQ